MSQTKETMSNKKTAEPVDPKSLIKETYVKEALTKDKGSLAQLTSWTIQDFTKKGDNFATIVTSIDIKFTVEGKPQTVTYVVKLNPCRSSLKSMEGFWGKLFHKEAEFYNKIGPALNSELTKIGLKGLGIAKCFYSHLEKDQEVIILEDLRPKGFQMFERRKGLDKAHCKLMLQELARFHAASVLLQAKTHQHLTQMYKTLPLDWTNIMEDPKEFISFMFSTNLENAEQLLHKVGGYEPAEKWLSEIRPVVFETLEKLLARMTPFEVICHGDCWNNNVLFRYNDEGDPVEVMLVDLQLNRLGSPALDLTYMMFTSLNGDVRRDSKDHFMAAYYNSFSEVLDLSGQARPFTMEELRQEFENKMEFGVLFAVPVLVVILSEGSDIPDLSDFKEEEISQRIQEWKDRTLRMMETNPLFRSRFLSIFDDMVLKYK